MPGKQPVAGQRRDRIGQRCDGTTEHATARIAVTSCQGQEDPDPATILFQQQHPYAQRPQRR
jgi:hypothetical protein